MGVVSELVQGLAKDYRIIDTEVDESHLSKFEDEWGYLEFMIVHYNMMKRVAMTAINALHVLEKKESEDESKGS